MKNALNTCSFFEDKEDEFINNGYAIFRNLFSASEVARMHEISMSLVDIARNLDFPHDHKKHLIMFNNSQFDVSFYNNQVSINRISWVLGLKPEFAEFSRSPKLLHIVSKFLQSEKADHIINSIHPKFPNDNVQWLVHQDISNRLVFDPKWKYINGDRSYVACITAIDPMSEENGGIYLIPGSHKLGRISKSNILQISIDKAIVPDLEAGDVICMNQYLVHYSLFNKANSSRILIVDGFSVVGATNVNAYKIAESDVVLNILGNDSSVNCNLENEV